MLAEQPLPLVSTAPGIDPGIAEVIASALEKDVSRRCESAARLADAFEQARARLGSDFRAARPTPPPPRPTGEQKPRRERAADAAYDRALASYQEGAEEFAKRSALEALAEHPPHAAARKLLGEMGRLGDVEPWLPQAPVAPPASDPSEALMANLPPVVSGLRGSPQREAVASGPGPEEPVETIIAPMAPPVPGRPATPARPPAQAAAGSQASIEAPGEAFDGSKTMIASPGSGPDSSKTMLASPGPAFDSSKTMLATPGPAFDSSKTMLASPGAGAHRRERRRSRRRPGRRRPRLHPGRCLLPHPCLRPRRSRLARAPAVRLRLAERDGRPPSDGD